MTSNKDKINQLIIRDFNEMSDLIITQLNIINDVFEFGDNSLSDNTIKSLKKNEEKIDKLEMKLDEMIIRDIVLYKPVASELRQLFAIYRISINLERIGDHVIKISDFIHNIKDSSILIKSSSTFHHMFKDASIMVNKSLLSFANSDTEYAFWTIKKEKNIEELNHKLLKKSIKKIEHVKDIQALLESLVDVNSIISSIERIGNHAVNIAEVTLYAILGKDIRHKNL